jgi:pimeloyl-ACP methyl ester carboxylesterase
MTDAKIAGLQEGFADVKGSRLRYLVGGDGEPLVLVHGFAGAATNWVEIAPVLARRYRVLVPDLPGHGLSSALSSTPGLAAFADRVAAIAAQERMLPAHVVGHSLGAVVALRIAGRTPAAVRSLVLVAPAGISSSTRWAELTLTAFGVLRPGKRIGRWVDAIARTPGLRRPVLGPWAVSDGTALSSEATRGLLAGPPLHTDTLSAGRALAQDDPRRDLDRVRCPCLVVGGARDVQVPVGNVFEYARRLGAQVRLVPDAGHLVIAERPDAVLDAIESFAGTRQATAASTGADRK